MASKVVSGLDRCENRRRRPIKRRGLFRQGCHKRKKLRLKKGFLFGPIMRPDNFSLA